MSFTNKVVIITGSSDGIGAEASVQFSKEGAKVVIVGRDEKKLKNVAEKCADPLVIRADIRNEDDAQRIIAETIKKFGTLDVLVNNAGALTVAAIEDSNILKSYDDMMNINVRSVVHLTSLAVPHLIKTKGNIVNVSGAGARMQIAGFSMLCVSEAALDSFTECTALELAPHGVRANAVSPGPVNTDILNKLGIPLTMDIYAENTALKKVAEPEEIVDMILYLASDKARSITGTNVVIDNGMLLRNQ